MSHEDTGSDIELLPPARPMQAGALEQLMAHAQAMSHAKALADALCDTEMVPARYKGKPGDAAAAILYGAELGLNPIQSLQNVFAVHGQPSIFAKTAVALVKRHGIKFDTIESTSTRVTVRARRGDEFEESTWTMERAKTAGFTSNKKYTTEPEAMLYSKAAMEVCRRIAPDILLGIAYSTEELELDSSAAAPRRVTSRRGVDGLRTALAAAPDIEDAEEVTEDTAAAPAHDTAMAPATRSKWLKRLTDLLAEAQCDGEDAMTVVADLSGRGERAPQAAEDLTDDELRQVVNNLNGLAKTGRLLERVNDILNIAVLRAAEATA
jgi:hypothetical protein